MKSISYHIILTVVVLTQFDCNRCNRINLKDPLKEERQKFDRVYSNRMNSDPYFYKVSRDSIERYFDYTDSLEVGDYVVIVDSNDVFYKAAAFWKFNLLDTIVEYREGNTKNFVALPRFISKAQNTDRIVYLKGKVIYYDSN